MTTDKQQTCTPALIGGLGALLLTLSPGCKPADCDPDTEDCGTSTTSTTTQSTVTTQTTTETTDVGQELVPRVFNKSTLLAVPSGDGMTLVNHEGDTVYFNPWWKSAPGGFCQTDCGAAGLIPYDGGLIAGINNVASGQAGFITYSEGEAALADEDVVEYSGGADVALDHRGASWISVSTDGSRVEWLDINDTSTVLQTLGPAIPGWGSMADIRSLEAFNLADSHYLLVTNGENGDATDTDAQGSVSLWNIDDMDNPTLTWTYPEGGHLSDPQGGVIRYHDGDLVLLYGHTSVSTVGVASLSDITAAPAYMADLEVDAEFGAFHDPVGLELTDDGVLFVVDRGTPFGFGLDAVRGWVYKGNLPDLTPSGATGADNDILTMVNLTGGSELIYNIGTPTEAHLWVTTLSDLAPLPPEPIYVNIVMHNEEGPKAGDIFPDYLKDESIYQAHRGLLIAYARLIEEYKLPLNWQSDWNFLQAVALFDVGTAATNNKNLVKWLYEDMGVVVDPHAHQTSFNYADVAYLVEALGVPPSNLVGGLVVDPPEDSELEQFFEPMVGWNYPSYTWEAQAMWGGGTINHLNEYQVMVSGIWRPMNAENYLVHDYASPTPHIGKYKPGWTGLNVLLEKQANNQLRRGRLHTLGITDGMVVFDLDPTFIDVQEQNFIKYANMEGVRFLTLQDMLQTWTDEYNERPHTISWQTHIDKTSP